MIFTGVQVFKYLRKNVSYKSQKVYNIDVPSDIRKEIIEALRGLNLSEEEINLAIKSNSFLSKIPSSD